jgi:hypothetical protein
MAPGEWMVGIASEQAEPGRRTTKLLSAAVQIMLAICYFCLLTPLAVLFRLGGWLKFGKRFGSQSESYWNKPDQPVARARSFKRLR